MNLDLQQWFVDKSFPRRAANTAEEMGKGA